MLLANFVKATYFVSLVMAVVAVGRLVAAVIARRRRTGAPLSRVILGRLTLDEELQIESDERRRVGVHPTFPGSATAFGWHVFNVSSAYSFAGWVFWSVAMGALKVAELLLGTAPIPLVAATGILSLLLMAMLVALGSAGGAAIVMLAAMAAARALVSGFSATISGDDDAGS